MLDKTPLLNRITQTPGKCGGRPCIRGMRIRVSDILETLADNEIMCLLVKFWQIFPI